MILCYLFFCIDLSSDIYSNLTTVAFNFLKDFKVYNDLEFDKYLGRIHCFIRRLLKNIFRTQLSTLTLIKQAKTYIL